MTFAAILLAALVTIGCSLPQVQNTDPPAVPDIPAPTTTPAPTFVPNTPAPPTSTSIPAPAETPIPVTTTEVAKLGDPAPDFELESFTGDKVRLSELEGKVVVLNFWASWCPPCRKEMPAFEKTWQEYRDQGVVFMGVAVQDHEPDSRAFASEVGVTYPIGLDRNGRIFDLYRPFAMPTTFIIDREGVVSRRINNYANEAMLRLFLKGQLEQ